MATAKVHSALNKQGKEKPERKRNPAALTADLADIEDAKKALAEYRQTGESYSLDQIKAELDL